ncbi:Rho guanine nucleotide exchange factor, putative [Hondaea fermentalgiana]|uniref:Rho guanine nucleotide exchange factor, putative n=1 Tax=Hondaea fermentalgiana TaxID=2315210 RepID=A0A2R5G4M0_9STRA|nr:Rho guanine nucleotide exchange factor, putative [Hondaea fermentalgiana]|eukprot:GBG25972.1 Rho guanine nucleotide exchange factor, putative [Hondaea fermentalgiana]
MPSSSCEPAAWERVCEEICETERRYADFLKILIEDFVPAVREVVAQSDCGSEHHVVRTIFGNVSQLYTLSLEFQVALKAARSKHTVGDLYRHIAPYFRLYRDYCSNHNDALALLSRLCATSKRFAKVVKDCEETAGRGQTFLSLLVMPIQRVPRHILLLQELIKRLPKDHKDLAACKEALAHMEQVASEINETVRQRENAVKVWEVQSAITTASEGASVAAGESTASPDCVSPIADDESVASAGTNVTAAGDRSQQDGGAVLFQTHRIFVKEGELVKLCTHRKTKKRRKFFLFNDCLVYARPGSKALMGRHRRKWYFRAKCEVIGAQDLPDGSPLADGASHALLIVTPDRNLVCLAQDNAEKDAWLHALRANAKPSGLVLPDAKGTSSLQSDASRDSTAATVKADGDAWWWIFLMLGLVLAFYYSSSRSKVLVFLTGVLLFAIVSLFTPPTSTSTVVPASTSGGQGNRSVLTSRAA